MEMQQTFTLICAFCVFLAGCSLALSDPSRCSVADALTPDRFNYTHTTGVYGIPISMHNFGASWNVPQPSQVSKCIKQGVSKDKNP